MLHTHLENFTADSPIIALQLAAKPCRPGRQQFGLFESALRDPNRFYETLARLTAVVGSENVGTPHALNSHRPDAFQLLPFKAERDNSHSAFRIPLVVRSGGTAEGGSSAIGLCLRRFRPPLAADVQLKDGRPCFISASGVIASVRAIQGPWLNSGDWWDTQAWGREEWDVELSDGLFRLFKQIDGWFLEGAYD